MICEKYHVCKRAQQQRRQEIRKHIINIVDCLQRFYSGDYGEVCADDTAANNADLAAGEGHILARYKQAHKLTGDFYIEAMIYEPMLNDINYNYIMVMYPDER